MLIGVDVGGTFTDVVVIGEGRIRTIKVPTDVRDTERGVLQGAREAGVKDAAVFNHASTHGLNAVITRRLPKVGFLTTEGHRDMLDRGRAWRPSAALTDPDWRRSFGDASRPIVPRYLRRSIKERITAHGDTLIPLDEEQARAEIRVLGRCGVEGVAICLINAYIFPEHERRLRELVHEVLGPIPCSISSSVSPVSREFPRAVTTVIDTFMRLIYGEYTERLDKGLREEGFKGALNYADCAAQLVSAEAALRKPFKIIFAGPAGGTVASEHFGKLIGVKDMLCSDVGGTSCDISLITNGKAFVTTTFELEHDLVVNALSVEISSIGAGGGSLVLADKVGAIQVGPGSAGSDPGPACYGKGGRFPTMTDCCLLMGVIDPDGFAGGRLPLNRELSRQAFERLETPIPFDQRVSYAFHTGVNNVAEGLSDVAVAHGVDPRDYSLIAFGAAGPMLLPAVLDLVHVAEVIVPPHPGLFSALGLVSSDQVYGDSRTAYEVLRPDAADRIDAIYAEMERNLRAEFEATACDVKFKRSFDGVLVGQAWDTPFVPVPEGRIDAAAIAQMIENFHDVYQQRFANRFPGNPVQGVTYRVEAVFPAPKVEYPRLARRMQGEPTAIRTVQIRHLQENPVTAHEYQREELCAGDVIKGPAIVREALSTTFMLPGQVMIVGDYGELRIRHDEAKAN